MLLSVFLEHYSFGQSSARGLPFSLNPNNKYILLTNDKVIDKIGINKAIIRYQQAQGIYSLELAQVFVESNIIPTTADQTSPNPIWMPTLLPEGDHTLLHHLTDKRLVDQHLVILGAPGSGKTTLLQYLVLVLVDHRHHQHKTRIPYKLPILLSLQDHVTSVKEISNFSLANATRDHLERRGKAELADWLGQRLTKGHCLILLDGLDEVANSEDCKQVVDWIQRQMVTYHKNRFIVTSRRFGYLDNPLSGVTVMTIHPFTIDQIKQFVHKWYLACEIMSTGKNDQGVYSMAKAGAEDLFGRIYDTPALLALAVNPLLLTMIVTIHRYRESLPEKRVALYSEICEVFLSRRETPGVVPELDAAKKQLVLQSLAYHMMCKGYQEISITEACKVIKDILARVNSQMPPEAFLRIVENTSGLLLARENGIYSFAHMTFQEYLAATHLATTHKQVKRVRNTLVKHLEEIWWCETIRLYCAQADASPIITACLDVNSLSTSILTLALECRQEAFQVGPNVNTRLDTFVDQGIEDADTERRHVVVEALLARRLRQMIRLKEETYRDTCFITCAEYQFFLDEQRAYNAHYQPDHWESIRFLPNQGLLPILGVRRSDASAFCAWLTKHDSGVWSYRLPKDGELEETGDKSVFSKLKVDTGYWVEGGKGFVWSKESQILPLIMKTIQERFDYDLTYDFDLDFDSARALEGVRHRAFERIRAHTLDLDRVFNLAHTLDFDHIPNHFFSRTCALLLKLVFAFDRTRALDLAFNHARALNLIQDLDNALAITYTFARSLARARDRDCIRDRAHDLAQTLDHARHQLSNSTEFHRNSSERREISEILCQCICLLAQALTMSLLYQPIDTSISQILLILPHHSNKKREDNVIQDVIDKYLDIFVNFTLLEKRIHGNLPAYEGIMIMKERKVD